MSTLAAKARRTTNARMLLAARVNLWRTGANQQRIASIARRRLDSIVAFASSNSPFYHDFYKGITVDSPLRLQDLPVLSKATMMNNIDWMFTDRQISYDGINRHLTSGLTGKRYLGEYRILATSGSTGRRGLFLYSRKEWAILLATFWRWTDMIGMFPGPGRRRIAVVGAPSAFHLTNRISSSLGLSAYKVLYLKAGAPTKDLVEQISAFEPTVLLSYPSICSMLALEQLDGRMNINPSIVTTGGEVLTLRMRDQIRQAWGINPLDFYAMTEVGLLAGDCREKGRMHLFNDTVIIEVVDDKYNAVPPGVVGSKVLITNLFLHTQPLIRYEISDMLAIDSIGCECKRAWPLIKTIDGRGDDLLWFPGRNGLEVAVHPMQLQSAIISLPEIRAYQIVQRGDTLRVQVVLDSRADVETTIQELRADLERKLSTIEILAPIISVNAVEAIACEPGPAAKVKLVVSDRHRLGLGHEIS
jgi:phenylacetate-CoA ligase